MCSIYLFNLSTIYFLFTIYPITSPVLGNILVGRIVPSITIAMGQGINLLFQILDNTHCVSHHSQIYMNPAPAHSTLPIKTVTYTCYLKETNLGQYFAKNGATDQNYNFDLIIIDKYISTPSTSPCSALHLCPSNPGLVQSKVLSQAANGTD